jgi:hypothetical protein
MSNIIAISDLERMATAAAASKMFGFKNKEEALAIMLLCQAEGLHPGIAMRDYHVIQGRPTLKADAMLARFLNGGGKVQWHELSDKVVSGTFSHPQGGEAKITWSFEDAKRIGLTGKDNWRNYPRAMLRSRVVSEGVRTVYPVAVVGVYTPEEAQDFAAVPQPTPTVIAAGEPQEIWPVLIPGSDDPYDVCASAAQWADSFGAMVDRVKASPKYSDEEKTEKLRLLHDANLATFAKLPEKLKAMLEA